MNTCKRGHEGAERNKAGFCLVCTKEYKGRLTEQGDATYAERANYLDFLQRLEKKKRAIDYLGGVCLDCGISDIRVLEFDHVQPKVCAVASLLGKSWETILKELVKCELVCSNCHSIRTYERRMATKKIPANSKPSIRSENVCVNGHQKSPENKFIQSSGKTGCRLCRLESSRRFRANKRLKEIGK